MNPPETMRNNAFHSTYLNDRLGHATLTPTTPCEAGSFASFILTYTAGYFGIDDTGGLKIVHRFASDMGKPQFADPAGWNYVTAEASNGALLELRFAASSGSTGRGSPTARARAPQWLRDRHCEARRQQAIGEARCETGHLVRGCDSDDVRRIQAAASAPHRAVLSNTWCDAVCSK